MCFCSSAIESHFMLIAKVSFSQPTAANMRCDLKIASKVCEFVTNLVIEADGSCCCWVNAHLCYRELPVWGVTGTLARPKSVQCRQALPTMSVSSLSFYHWFPMGVMAATQYVWGLTTQRQSYLCNLALACVMCNPQAKHCHRYVFLQMVSQL